MLILIRLNDISEILQKKFNNKLYPYFNILVILYKKDILIYLEILKEYIKYVNLVLKPLYQINLYLKLDKYKFY